MEEERRLRAFELWCYGSILEGSWRDELTTDKILKRIGCSREIMGGIRKRRGMLLGH